jgi:hypothetical protein
MSGMKPGNIQLSLTSEGLREAAKDFRYLLDRGYPRKNALELVGNRYQLDYDHRHLLHRGVFPRADAALRRKKLVSIKALRGRDLAIDGHNVIITVEAALSGRPLIQADDGFIRDISGLSGKFRKSAQTEAAIRLILDVLRRAKPRHTLFLFDAPISRSGDLAREVQTRMEEEGLPGNARTEPVPEKILIGFPGIVATSDTTIIDQSEEVFDLAGHIVNQINRKLLKTTGGR